MQGNDTHPWQSGNTSTVGYSQSPETSSLCEQMAWRGCICHSCPWVHCPVSQNITSFLSEWRFAGLNPKSWSQDWIFFFRASEIALLKLPWFKTWQRGKKKGQHVGLFSAIFDSWDLSGAFKFCATIVSLGKFSCQSKLSCICCKLLRLIAA